MTRRSRLVRLTALLTVAALGFAACTDDGDTATEDTAPPSEDTSPPSEDTAAEATGTITIENFAFRAGEVAGGAKITIENKDTVPHTVTADDESFDAGRIEGGGTGEMTAPGTPGEYPFHCEIHPSIKATLVVT